jgi:hypothetical protein
MRPLLPAFAALATFSTVAACSDGVRIPEVQAAFDEVVTALEQKDPVRLWALSHPEAQKALLDLASDAAAAASAANDLWGPPDTPEGGRARAALGGELAGLWALPEAERGPKLVAHFVDLTALAWSEGSRESVSLARVTVDENVPDVAVVRIPSGESITFKTHDGDWRTSLLMDLVVDSDRFKSLRANIDKTQALAEEQAQVWRTGLDAATPQGAWNLLRRELPKGPEAATFVFRLLNAPSRAVLREALEAARASQRRIQQRVARAGREQAYREAGIADHVSARSDIELFERWYRTHLLPTTWADDAPERFERDGADKGVLITKGGLRHPMSRESGGTWALGGLEEIIRRDLLEPLRREAPPEAPAESPASP